MQYAHIIIRETYLVKAFFSNIHIEHFFQVFFLFNTWYTIKIFSSMYSVYYIELKDLSSYKLGHWKCNSSTNKHMSFWLIYFANCIGISKRTFLDKELIKDTFTYQIQEKNEKNHLIFLNCSLLFYLIQQKKSKIFLQCH